MTAADRTLHRRIRSDISERILSGEWAPGRRIPSEHELMADYGCSRMTVNKALTPLADSGLIVRRRRAGSFVAPPRIHSPVLDIPDIRAEVAARGETYGYERLTQAVRAAGDQDIASLGLEGAGRVLAFLGLHRADGRPFALEERLINLGAAPAAEGVDFEMLSPGQWLLSSVPWTAAEHTIRAINPSPAVAKHLGVAASTACLVLERRTWRAEAPVTWVRMTFPGEAYDLIARFTPGSEPA
jgi:GntR family histidine utilization transcriptional repressor